MSGALIIIKEHNGTINIKNTELGKGTVIEIVIPFSQNIDLEENIDTEIMSLKFKKPPKVLWVEDDKLIIEIARNMIDRLGLKGDVASSGAQALEYLSHKSYDFVITDIGMPEMNGWQLADTIKERFAGKLKVAVISGWGSQIEESEKKAHGVVYVLDKPFSINQLQKLFGTLYNKKLQ